LAILSKEKVKCLQHNAQATNILFSALSEDVFDVVIFREVNRLMMLISFGPHSKKYDKSKCDEKLLSLEEPLEECSTSPINEEPQVILPKGLSDHATSTSLQTYDLTEGNKIVGENNVFTLVLLIPLVFVRLTF
jgi:hypothetical protein